MEAPLGHINCRNLTHESVDKLTNMSSRIQDTTYFIFADDSRVKSYHLFLLFYTEGHLRRTSMLPVPGVRI